MLPVYVSILGGAQTGKDADPAAAKQRLRRAGIGFAVGLSLVFVALGVAASAIAAPIMAHAKTVSIVAGILMVLFGAKLLGILRLPWLENEKRPFLDRIPSPRGALGGVLFGAAFGLGWTPCVGPVLGAALTYAATTSASPLAAAVQLAIYSLGLSTPLVAAAFAAGPVLAFVRRFQGATPIIQRATGLLLVVVGVVLASGQLGKLSAIGTSQAAEPCESQKTPTCTANTVSPSAGELRLPVGKPRLLEFMSDHCTVCARMAPVVAKLEHNCTANDGTIMRINVEEPSGSALAARYGVRVVPSFVSVDSQGSEIDRVVGELPAELLEVVLAEVRGKACSAL
jgi:cytochrome c-type biogenesis protein